MLIAMPTDSFSWLHLDYPAAITAFQEALDLSRSLSSKSLDVADCLNSLAGALRQSGQLDKAEIHYREALVIAKALPDSQRISIYTGNLAELALDREQWPEAERLSRLRSPRLKEAQAALDECLS